MYSPLQKLGQHDAVVRVLDQVSNVTSNPCIPEADWLTLTNHSQPN